ncbi:MAG TPA: Ig-like domain repeat protein [Thermoanaerobaculia bacterium]|jgi:hypothetical protein
MIIRTTLVVSLVVAMAQPAWAGCVMASFEERRPAISAGHDVTQAAVGDLGNDGDLDFVTVSSALTDFAVNVHVSDDGGYLAPFAVAGSRPTDVALADLNGDGLLDILLAEQAADLEGCRQFGSCVSLRRVLADANGGFASAGQPAVIPYADTVERLVAADFNHDGEMDVLVAARPIDAADPALHLIWGSDPDSGAVAGGTTQTFTLDGPIADVAIGDFNNDTFTDFAAAIGKSATTTASRVDMYLNAEGAFGASSSSATLPSTDSRLRLVTGQFNKLDTHLDLAVAMYKSTLTDNGGSVRILINANGTGTLQPGGTMSVSSRSYADLVAGDFDEDAVPDLSVLDSGLTFHYNAGNGNFRQPFATTLMAGDFGGVFSGDFDRDGRDDVAYLHSPVDTINIFLNTCEARYVKVALTSSPNPSTFGGTVTFTASLSVKPGAPVPTGTVTLYEGSTVLGSASVNSAGNVSITVANLSIGSHSVKAHYSGNPDLDYPGADSNTLVHTVHRPPFGAPLNVVATGNAAANAITIRWTSTADVSTHHVMRRNDLGQWHMVGSTPTEQFTDPTVDPSRAYVYTVRSVHATNGTVSPDGNLDVATTMNPVRPSDKIVRAADTTDVRSLANSLRRAAGLAPFSFTDATLTGLPVKAVHLTELRTAIAQARAALGLPAVALSQPTITPRVTKAKFNDLQELRMAFY